jgi:cyclase
MAQQGRGETVIQTAIEQFENNSLKTIPLDKGIFIFSGDGENVTAIADESSTMVIDSGVTSRESESSEAIFKATWCPVTRLVNTHWHFDHTGGNGSFGAGGVNIIAQENVKNVSRRPRT